MTEDIRLQNVEVQGRAGLLEGLINAIDGADHLFDGKVSEVGDAIEDLLLDFHG
jgi:alpha/beta superfamily hydrolase